MDLSIIIVNYNCIEFINKCVGSILSFLPDDSKGNGLKAFSWELIIVDNYSTDNSTGYLKKITEQYNNFSLIVNKSNEGFSKASNEGARKAKGEFLLFLNPDTEFIREGIEEVLEFYRNKITGKKIGIIGVKILNPDGSLQYSCRSFPMISRQFYESFFLYRIFKKSKIFGSYFMSYWDHNSKMEVDWLTGAFMLLKKEIFFMVGGFDENYFMYSEDTDLCLKVKRAGFSNYYFDTF
ncbi:MAG: glycosyltransferase family 2 protein, partial [Actinobacteria bacterium]|nr:glycosyltransferase family 2 protein [Actinomycetota bacterium]